jgi:hypothetical protein
MCKAVWFVFIGKLLKMHSHIGQRIDYSLQVSMNQLLK